MRKVIILVCLLLLTYRPVSASPVVILGAGEVDLGPDVVVTMLQDKKNNVSYSFMAKDGTVWRGALLMPITNLFSNDFGNILKLDGFLDQVVDKKFSHDKNFLAADKAKLIRLGGKECATTALKLSVPTSGIITNMEMIAIPAVDSMKMFTFTCADSDTQYWRPLLQKVAASLP